MAEKVVMLSRYIDIDIYDVNVKNYVCHVFRYQNIK